MSYAISKMGITIDIPNAIFYRFILLAIDIPDRRTPSSSFITNHGTVWPTYLFLISAETHRYYRCVRPHNTTQYNKTFNFSIGRLELIVGWETVTVDPIKLNHSVIPSAHVYVIMVVVDTAFDKMYQEKKKLFYEKNKLNQP